MAGDIFDQSEASLPCLFELMEDEEFQRLLDCFDSDNIADQSPVSLLTQPSETEQDPICGHAEPSQEFENPTEFGALDCSRCVLLREVVHTNGLQYSKLSIHGGLNVFYHAMLQITYSVDGLLHVMEPSYIDFSTQSFEEVKQFLIEYGLLRAREGFVAIQDSFSSFYDALYVRMDFDEAIMDNNEMKPLEQGLYQSRPRVDDGPFTPEKPGIAAQRERTATLQLRDFADYFHLPIIDAAKEMNICATVLKKVCRKYGMARWPHRKIKSIEKKISKLQEELRARGGQGDVSIEAEIEKLRIQKAQIFHGLLS